ncbi:MAG: alkaline phosphatase family protein [Byssovorax sp.]
MRAVPSLLTALLATSWLAFGCSNADTTSGSSGTGGTVVTPPLPGPTEWNRDVTPPGDDDARVKRAACGYKAGDLPAETQGKSHPSGSQIPVEHILVLMQENRSFDHYFQKLPEYGQPDVEVAPPGFTNPDAKGDPVAPFHDTQFCFVDTNHDWAGVHQQVGGGKMDGFFASNDGHHEAPVNGTLDMISGKRAMGYYDQTDLPFYYALASEYAIADHYHSSMLGPTWPNRMFLYAASSLGITSNSFPETDKTLLDYLEERQVDWKVYTSGTPGFGVFVAQFLKYREDHFKGIEEYFADAAAGTLPQFAFVESKIGDERFDQNDEHPPAIAPLGEAFTATVVDALSKSPNWSKSALFITYDEHGGLYDHVVPPAACPADDLPVKLGPGDPDAKLDQLGIRVPMMVVSPFAKKHFVAHHTYDHTSIVRFVEAKFVLPALSNRDANAEAPWEMFDFDAPPHATPPTLPVPPSVQSTVDACAKIWKP